MADKVRVHNLAKELGMSNAELLDVLHAEGIEVASHLSSVDADVAELVVSHMADERAGKAKIPVLDLLLEPALADDLPKDVAEQYEPIERQIWKKPKKKKEQTDLELAAAAQAALQVPVSQAVPRSCGEIHVKQPIIVKDLAMELGIKPNTLIHELLSMNIFAAINQTIDIDVAAKICTKFGFKLVSDKRDKGIQPKEVDDEIEPEDIDYGDAELVGRSPVVTFLGHVDHGKTSLLDRIRNSKVTSGEAGGITQHIGASVIQYQGRQITFIDTPGHEAFTSMRSRGANVTDIAVLIVAADDGFMPQTVEALSHARAAGVQIIVAINKMDLPAANPDKVLLHMQQNELSPEDWGGDVGVIRVSAVTGEGVNTLLERILLESEMLELKASPDLPVKAIVLEAQLEQGLGATASILVKNGTVRVGDMVLCGQLFGKVKALIDCQGKRVKSAGPSDAVKIVGLNGVPGCGMQLVGCADEKQARRLADGRLTEHREDTLLPTRKASLEDLFRQIEEGTRQELTLIVKSDVRGSGEAIRDSLLKIHSDKISLKIIHLGVGSITENDILLAAASDAVVLGFHVRVNPGVNAVAKRENVDVRLYSVIYELVEQVKEALRGLLEPDLREEPLGTARILQIFTVSKTGKICGCSVSKGVMRSGAKARVFRGTELIYNGSIASLRRFQDDVKEVRAGLECGIRLDNFFDFETDDVIDVYELKELPAEL